MIETVVKLGGGLLAHATSFDAALATISDAARKRRLLVVPGGGPFADAVRAVDRRFPLSDDAAHWMAVLAMDQYAHLLATRLAGAALVADPREIGDGSPYVHGDLSPTSVPVLAPYRWLRETDPLPHTWNVTSDSIAAWVAGQVGAKQLVLVKPPGASGELVDAYFTRTLPAQIKSEIVPADDIERLRSALSG